MLPLTSKQNFFQSLGLSLGTIVNSLLGLIFYLLVARSLGPAGFGQFSFVLGLGVLAAELGDLGFGSALVKFGSGPDFSRLFSLTLLQRVVISVGILAVFLPRQAWSAGVGISLLLFSLVTQGFLARQKYGAYIGVSLFGNIVRLLFLFFVPALVAFSLANVLAFGAGVILHGRVYDFRAMKEDFIKVFGYARWLAASYAVASLAAKADIPVLYLLGGATVTGVYSSAQKLTSVFAQVAAALEGVFAPKLSSSEKDKPFRDYLLVAAAAAAGTLIVTVFSGLIIPLVFGSKYLEAVPVFNWLLVGMAVFFISGPFTAVVLYQKGKSAFHLVGSALQLLISVGLYFLLIPRFGIWGAVGTFILSQAFNMSYYLFVWQYVRHRS